MKNENDAPQTLEELTARIESMFELGPEGDRALAVTGEPFIKLVIGGEVAEGEPYELMALSEQAAVRYFYLDLMEYADRITNGVFTGHSLYWRKKPVLITLECKEVTWRSIDRPKAAEDDPTEPRKFFYQIRARLLISDKPAIHSKEATA